MNQDLTAPEALLLVAPGCPHCSVVREALTQLVSEGLIGALEIVDIATAPQRATELGVRSVPWTRIGRFEFQGAYSASELRHWAQQAAAADGLSNYLQHLLTAGQLAQVQRLVRRDPTYLHGLLPLLADPHLDINIHIGVGAVLEDLQGSPLLEPIVAELGELSRSASAKTRADACHYLALTESQAARPFLETALHDSDGDVRDIAAEGLAELDGNHR